MAYLLPLLADYYYFGFVIALAFSFILDLAIGEVKLINNEVTIGFLGWFLWNNLINFQRC